MYTILIDKWTPMDIETVCKQQHNNIDLTNFQQYNDTPKRIVQQQ